MSQLPTPGGSTGTWGQELNSFLTTTHINNANDPESGKLYTDLSTVVSGGKVGIGTSTPSSSLHVVSTNVRCTQMAVIWC